MIQKVFADNGFMIFIGGIFLCGILAAIMSTADSQLLVSASAVSKDIYKGLINKDAEDKKVLIISRVTVIVVAVIAILIAWDPESSIMNLVSDAWAGLGAAFGPLVVLSLFYVTGWIRTKVDNKEADEMSLNLGKGFGAFFAVRILFRLIDNNHDFVF